MNLQWSIAKNLDLELLFYIAMHDPAIYLFFYRHVLRRDINMYIITFKCLQSNPKDLCALECRDIHLAYTLF